MMTITINKKDVTTMRDTLYPMYEMIGESTEMLKEFGELIEKWNNDDINVHINSCHIYTKGADMIMEISEEYVNKFMQFTVKYAALVIPQILSLISISKSMTEDYKSIINWSVQSAETKKEKDIKKIKNKIKDLKESKANIQNALNALENEKAEEDDGTISTLAKKIGAIEKEIEKAEEELKETKEKEETDFNEVKYEKSESSQKNTYNEI